MHVLVEYSRIQERVCEQLLGGCSLHGVHLQGLLEKVEHLRRARLGFEIDGIPEDTMRSSAVIGVSPSANSLHMMPSDQTSTANEYDLDLMSSGAIQSGVPTTDFLHSVSPPDQLELHSACDLTLYSDWNCHSS
jgi:hypothetical protein